MDETGFSQTEETKKVIAAADSKNVWLKATEDSFHITISVWIAADGFVILLLFLLLGKQLPHNTLDKGQIDGAKVTTMQKGHMTANCFKLFLHHLDNSVPAAINRPLLLIYDGFSGHYNNDIANKCSHLHIIPIFLPSNSTDLLQPLDVAVFKNLKYYLSKTINKHVFETTK